MLLDQSGKKSKYSTNSSASRSRGRSGISNSGRSGTVEVQAIKQRNQAASKTRLAKIAPGQTTAAHLPLPFLSTLDPSTHFIPNQSQPNLRGSSRNPLHSPDHNPQPPLQLTPSTNCFAASTVPSRALLRSRLNDDCCSPDLSQQPRRAIFRLAHPPT